MYQSKHSMKDYNNTPFQVVLKNKKEPTLHAIIGF